MGHATWTHEPEPPSGAPPGWYPVLVCWDPVEGGFPTACYWTGTKWGDGAPVYCYGPAQPDEVAAQAWASANDPDDLS